MEGSQTQPPTESLLPAPAPVGARSDEDQNYMKGIKEFVQRRIDEAKLHFTKV